jgi:eukaryotic-like serine/threonine-protein kinase
MSAEPAAAETDACDLDLDLCIDALCDRFEDVWRAGGRPRIEEYLERAGPLSDHPQLLPELVRLDAEYRCQVGEQPAPDEYRRRFPHLPAEGLEAALTARTVTWPRGSIRTGGNSASLVPAMPAGFDYLAKLGDGGQGDVYKVRETGQTGLKRVLALKMLKLGLGGPREVGRFRFEAEAVARLDHVNIVPVYTFDEHAGRPFFTMKLMEGGSMEGRMAALRNAPRDAARLVARVARAVHHAHQRGVIHRDLKPGNILVDAQGEPHIADFGLAKSADASSSLNLSGKVVGTFSYMAPEQARGERGLTTAVDVYGLGAILYEALTGRPPFKGPTVVDILRQVAEQPPVPPGSIHSQADQDLEAVCLKCLQKNPKDRYPSAAAVAEDLECYVDGKSVSARRASLMEELAAAIGGRGRVPLVDNWTAQSLLSSLLIVGGHAIIFGLVQAGAATPWLWLTLVLYWWFGAWPRWRMARRFRSLAPVDRGFLAVWVAHMFASIAVFLATGPLTAAAPVSEVLNWYPAMAALTGIPVFVVASAYWGVGYLFGMGYFVLSVALRFWPEAGPLAFGFYHGGVVTAFGCFYHRSVREERRSGELLVP